MNPKRLLTVGVVLLLVVLVGFVSPSFAQLNEPGLVEGPCNYQTWPETGCSPGEYCSSGNECILPHSGIEEFREYWANVEMEKYIEAKNSEEANISIFGNDQFSTFQSTLVCNLGSGPGCDDNNAQAGAIQSITSLIGSMYSNPPANTYAYVVDLADSMNIATPAHAQGIGFSSLEPILEAWKIMRNVAYLFFVLIFLGIGFMIMFRRKVGQAAVTAQQAIPNIIVSLIMVTFSYAIAGLLIDLMYLLMFLMEGLFDQSSTNLIGLNPFSMAWYFIGNGSVEGAQAIGTAVDRAIGSGIIGDIAGVISGLTALVIILVIIVFNIFKLFLALLKVYVRLILTITFAPIVLMMGSVPGRTVFMPWIKSLVGNLAVFPAILMVILVFQMLTSIGDSGDTGFSPPFMVSGLASSLPVIAGLALVLALPKLVEEVVKKFGGDQDGILGTAFSTSFASAKQAGSYAAPLAGAAATTAIDVPRNIWGQRGQPMSFRKRLAALRTGYDIRNDEGEVVSRRRGLVDSLGAGLRGGQQVRKYGQRFFEGRLFDPEDAEKLLARIAADKKEKKEPKSTKPIDTP